MLLADNIPHPVRTVVGKVKEEGAGLVLLDELHGMVGDDFGGVFRLLVDLALPDHLVVVESGRVPACLSKPVGESFLRMQVVAQVPFTGEAGGIADLGQDLRQGAELPDGGVSLVADLGRRGNVDVHAVLGGHEARQEGCAAGGTDGVIAIGTIEPQALRRQPVNIRGANLFVAVAAEGPGAMVVGEDEDQVGPG